MKKILFFFALGFLTTFSFSMDHSHLPFTRLLVRTCEVRDELHAMLHTALNADRAVVSADLAFITNHKVIELLKAISQKKESSVSLHIDANRLENQSVLQELQRSKIMLKTGSQHGKRVLISYMNYDESTENTLVYEGSYNPNNTQRGRRKNVEIGLFTYNKLSYYQKHLKSHKEGMLETADGAHILPHTPRRTQVYDTTLFQLTESLTERIHPERGGTLYLGTMGYSHHKLHERLASFCKSGGRVHLMVDFETLKESTKQLLDELVHVGAQVVIGKADNANGLKGIFHRKYLVRLTDLNQVDLVVLQSENFTNRTQPVFNHGSYHPDNHELGALLIEEHISLASHSSSIQYLGKKILEPELPKTLVASSKSTVPQRAPKKKKKKSAPSKQERKCCKSLFTLWAYLFNKK